MSENERDRLEGSGYCEHGNKPMTCLKCKGEQEQKQETEPFSEQERNIAKSKSLIESVGGSIDVRTSLYKQFDAKKISRDGGHFVQELKSHGFLDSALAERLGELFQAAQSDLDLAASQMSL